MKNFIYIVLFLLLVTSCSKDEIDLFVETDYLSIDIEPKENQKYPEYTHTFVFDNEDVNSTTITVPVIIAGRPTAQLRNFKIQVVDTLTTALEGTHFESINQELNVIDANSSNGHISLEINRTANLKNETLTIGLEIISDDTFGQGPNPLVTVNITDRLVKPDWWYTKGNNPWSSDPNLGYYTEEKLKQWFEFWDINDGTDPWSLEPYTYEYYSEYFGEWMIGTNLALMRITIEEFRQWLLKKDPQPIDENGDKVADTLDTLE
ncbi:DUF4843 domain-containing protein [Marinifilum sp.]|uniref:DUF4843 domain-containing protein n=1 Tax=Marinifilum sp. TaxID=2033137 RepID=UPI003BAD745F